MVKPLSFKGDKKPKKRKLRDEHGPEQRHSKKPASSNDTTAVAASAQNEEHATDEQSWVSADVASDLNGPVIFVLPSDPPTCIACDANGQVFASELENMIEKDPSTAEPHDVRQVWVATKVAGAEGFGFKGHHGRYLGCDKYGILSATAAAISPFESFIPIQAHDTPGMFAFQTHGGEGETDTFVTVKQDTNKGSSAVEIRGDASSINFESTIRVRMQARFKPKLKESRETKAREKISRRELEAAVGRRLEDHEVKRLKKARREGNYHEEILDVRVSGKHDKFAS